MKLKKVLLVFALIALFFATTAFSSPKANTASRDDQLKMVSQKYTDERAEADALYDQGNRIINQMTEEITKDKTVSVEKRLQLLAKVNTKWINLWSTWATVKNRLIFAEANEKYNIILSTNKF